MVTGLTRVTDGLCFYAYNCLIEILRQVNPVMLLWCGSGFNMISTEVTGLTQGGFEEGYVGPEVMAAHLKAISAYSCGTWQDAVKVAQRV